MIDLQQEAYALWERSLTPAERESIAEEENFREHYEELIQAEEEATK